MSSFYRDWLIRLVWWSLIYEPHPQYSGSHGIVRRRGGEILGEEEKKYFRMSLKRDYKPIRRWKRVSNLMCSIWSSAASATATPSSFSCLTDSCYWKLYKPQFPLLQSPNLVLLVSAWCQQFGLWDLLIPNSQTWGRLQLTTFTE